MIFQTSLDYLMMILLKGLSCSPNLNSIEYLWNIMKKIVPMEIPIGHLKELIKSISPPKIFDNLAKALQYHCLPKVKTL